MAAKKRARGRRAKTKAKTKSKAKEKASGADNMKNFSRKNRLLGAANMGPIRGNYLKESMPGCFVAHYGGQDDWILGFEAFSREEYGLSPNDHVPDISIDPEEGVLSLINCSERTRAYYISLQGDNFKAFDRRRRYMAPGKHRDTKGTVHTCLTLIATVPPNKTAELCVLKLPPGGPAEINIHSDISDVDVTSGENSTYLPSSELKSLSPTKGELPPMKTTTRSAFLFPLGGKGPFLCSQGQGGRFTHFYPATQHAIDFECPIGTPVVAIANGKIREVRDQETAGGIHVSSLYRWNSISINLEDGGLLDYVHIRAGSARVKVGDSVTAGQIICETGDVGFCPTAHLHIQLTASAAKDAPTKPLKFSFSPISFDRSHPRHAFPHFDDTHRSPNPSTNATTPSSPPEAYVPVAGAWYSPACGHVIEECLAGEGTFGDRKARSEDMKGRDNNRCSGMEKVTIPSKEKWGFVLSCHEALVFGWPSSCPRARAIVCEYLMSLSLRR